jgi:hypothetical protein
MTASGVWQKRARTIALASRDAMSRAIARPEIEIAFCEDDAVLLGAFQRACDGPEGAIQRGTGGCAVRVGAGTLHVLVALPSFEEDESVILNRLTRPLLRALRARYFGRDWIDVDHRPVAHVGFAHERATRRTVFEAFVAVRTPFAIADRPSYLGKKPATLEELRGTIDDAALVRTIADAYGHETRDASTSTSHEHEPRVTSAPWKARLDEAIGPVCAGADDAGRMRIGGEWMASFDAVRDLEDRLAEKQEIRAAVDAAFTVPHTALFGVRTLESFAKVIACAENP